MIEIEEALAMCVGAIEPLAPEIVDICESIGRVLAADAYSRVDLPRFDQSAVDGFAVIASSTASATSANPAWLALQGISAPGAGRLVCAEPDCAVRILTGARIPQGADAVIAQEAVEVSKSRIGVTTFVEKFKNIRRRGEESRAGTVLARAGQRIGAGMLGALISGGVSQLHVRRPPRIWVMTTGDELRPAGASLDEGQIPNSNGPMVKAMLASWGYHDVTVEHVIDDASLVSEAMQSAFQAYDLLITTGGASVGDRDFIVSAAEAQGVKRVFWRVAQKPGKPIYVGVWSGIGRRQSLLVGLPGNPGAVFGCLAVYVRRVLNLLEGQTAPAPNWQYARLRTSVRPDPARAHLLRMVVSSQADGSVDLTLLPRQDSHMLSNCSEATALALVPAGSAILEAGTVLKWVSL